MVKPETRKKNEQKVPIQGLGPSVEKAPPVKKVSSKLMDMKFMQKARAREEIEQEEEAQKKLQDESHWSISHLEKAPKKPTKTAMSYSDLMDTTQVSGRRSWGNFNAQPEVEEKKEFEVKEESEPGKKLKRKSTDGKANDKRKKRKSE